MERFSNELKAVHTDQEDLARIEATRERLEQSLVVEGDGFLLSPVSTTPSKFADILQFGLRRSIELTDSAIREMSRLNVSSSCVLVRGVFETGCLLYDTVRQVEKTVEGGQAAAMNDLHERLANTLLGHGPKAKTFFFMEERVVTNILTIIQRLSKELDGPFEGFYEGLSEHCHPNAHGMVLTYTLTHRNGVTTYTERNPARAQQAVLLAVGALGTALDLVAQALSEGPELYEQLAVLCEKNIHAQGTWPADTEYPITVRPLRDRAYRTEGILRPVSEEPRPPEEQEISVADAYRLMHHFNSQVTYGRSGMNALQLREMLDKKINWKETLREYDDLQRRHASMWLRPVWSWGGMSAGFVLVYALDGWWKIAGWILIGWILYQHTRADARRDGYYDGYDTGRQAAIMEVFEITDEEQKDYHERSIQMEIDEGVVEHLDEKAQSKT